VCLARDASAWVLCSTTKPNRRPGGYARWRRRGLLGIALDLVLADPACDGVLAILVPQVLVNPAKVVNAVAGAAARQTAPAKLCCSV
jgi:hypothetical protein